MTRRIVILGAGMAGLWSGYRLSQQGFDVTIVEAADRAGGHIHTRTLGNNTVDVGAEALHLGAPILADVVNELGLASSVVPAATGTTLIGSDNTVKKMPAGVGPFGPTRLGPVIRSAILSTSGLLRAGREPLHLKRRLSSGDMSVGDFLAERFGREVVDRIVAPLLGNLHSGDVYRLSLRATAPQLVPAAVNGTSLLRKRPRQGTVGGGTGFASWPGGMVTLVERLAGDLDVRLSTPATRLSRSATTWTVHTDNGDLDADGIIVTTPATVAARLLDPLANGVGGSLRAGRVASVASVVVQYPAASLPEKLTGVNGILMTPDSPQVLKAATIVSNKWPELASDQVVVRLSAGRIGRDTIDRLNDEQLQIHLQREFAHLVGMEAEPIDAIVARWGVPQAEVGHKRRLLRVRNGLTLLPPMALAGGAYDGLGMASVTRSAETAVALLTSALADSVT